MTTVLDLAYIALLVVGWPAYDHFVEWPRFRRELQVDASRARRGMYRRTVLVQWLLVGLGALLFTGTERPWGTPGLEPPAGWRLYGAATATILLGALYARQGVALQRSPAARAALGTRLADVPFLAIIPRDRRELRWWSLLAVTAGICEELLYRGFLIWLLAPWLGWWPAAACSAVGFAFLHAYQGRSGIVRTGAVGLFMTGTVAITASLRPAMALHALIDLGGVALLALALRDNSASAPELASDRETRRNRTAV